MAHYYLFLNMSKDKTKAKGVFTSLVAAKLAAREDSHNSLKWTHWIANPNSPQEEDWWVSDDRQNILVEKPPR